MFKTGRFLSNYNEKKRNSLFGVDTTDDESVSVELRW